MEIKRLSFLSLLEIHEHLNEMLLLHQEALLALDVELALASLKQFEIQLRAHMHVEEDLLLPVYARAGRIQGGPIEFYTGEHKRMLEFLGRFTERLEKLKANPENLKRGIIELFDDEAQFKQLMQHHDAREENILYPTLDKVTSKEERVELLSRCRTLVAPPNETIIERDGTMPITIGKKIESDYSNPLGLLSDCHRRIEMFLDVLITVSSQARGSNLNNDQRQALEAALKYFREAAPKHTRDEEESLFPRMLASADKRARSAISLLDELHADHEKADADHAQVEELGTRWLSEGGLSIRSVDRLTELLDQLQQTYQRHIALEDHEVFPLAGEILSASEIANVGREMATRRSIDLSAIESKLSLSSEADKP